MAGRDTVALVCFLVLLGASKSQDADPSNATTTVSDPVAYSDLIGLPISRVCLGRVHRMLPYTVNGKEFGRISEPQGLYPNNFHCTLKIEAPFNAVLEFYFRKLQIEDSPECEKDKVRLYISTDNTNYQSIVDFCGVHHKRTGPCYGLKQKAPYVKTGTRYMMLILNTDGNGQDRGYQIKFRAKSGPAALSVYCVSSCPYRCQRPPIIRSTTTTTTPIPTTTTTTPTTTTTTPTTTTTTPTTTTTTPTTTTTTPTTTTTTPTTTTTTLTTTSSPTSTTTTTPTTTTTTPTTTTTTPTTTTTTPTTTTAGGEVPFVLAALEDTCGMVPTQAGDDTQFVVGGSSITWSDRPWTVALYRLTNGVISYRCGATVIDEMWVVTGAHCVTVSTTYYIKAVTTTLAPSYPASDLIQVAQVISHPNYNAPILDNNIALVRLTSPLPATTVAACLRAEAAPVGQMSCVVSGWGRTSENSANSPDLQAATLSIWTNTDCINSYRTHGSTLTITNNMFCASGPSATGTGLAGGCYGDGGTPLACESSGKSYLDGLTTKGQGCGRTGLPGIFTRISPYFNWILASTGSSRPDDNVDPIVCGLRSHRASPYVVGGTAVSANEYPWMVAILRFGNYICTGTIVDEYWVLTVAHCVSGDISARYDVVVGAHDIYNDQNIEIRVNQIRIHPSFSRLSLRANIAMLGLSTRLEFSNTVKPACLSSTNPLVDETCTVAGWGTSGAEFRPATPQQAQLPVWDNNVCINSYNNRGGGGSRILNDMLCAGRPQGGPGPCGGDGGAGLYCTNVAGFSFVSAIAAWGRGCGRPGLPSVFIRVANYHDWIISIITAGAPSTTTATSTTTQTTTPTTPTTTTTTPTTTTTTTVTTTTQPTTFTCGQRPSFTRIIGGVEAQANTWPWMVTLQYRTSNGNIFFTCGGSIVHENWVITAAHCVDTPRNFQVRVGAHHRFNAGTVINVDRYIYHNSYSDRTLDYDIALLHLQTPLTFDQENIQPICLPNADFAASTTCTVTGWGATQDPNPTYPSLLQELDVNLWTNSDCRGPYGSSITDRMICAGGVAQMDSCYGDSGGPLACPQNGRWYLQGVVSWGRTPCASGGVPGVYVRVTQFRQWLTANSDGQV